MYCVKFLIGFVQPLYQTKHLYKNCFGALKSVAE